MFFSWTNQLMSVEPTVPSFGAEYRFSLDDAIDSCPEYLVDFEVLTKLASEFGLELVLHANFYDYFVSEASSMKGRTLLSSLHVPSIDTFTIDELQVFGSYCLFAFTKRRVYCEDDQLVVFDDVT